MMMHLALSLCPPPQHLAQNKGLVVILSISNQGAGHKTSCVSPFALNGSTCYANPEALGLEK